MAKLVKTDIDMDGNGIQNLSAPVNDNDVCNKKWTSDYVVAQIQASLSDITADISGIEDEIDTLDTQLTTKIDTDIASLNSSIQESLTTIRQSITSINTNISGLDSDIDEIRDSMKQYLVDDSIISLADETEITNIINGELFLEMTETSQPIIIVHYNGTWYEKGDVNQDGVINQTDHDLVYGHIAETAPLTGLAFELADVNSDGKVNIKDWNRMYEYIAGINTQSMGKVLDGDGSINTTSVMRKLVNGSDVHAIYMTLLYPAFEMPSAPQFETLILTYDRATEKVYKGEVILPIPTPNE